MYFTFSSNFLHQMFSNGYIHVVIFKPLTHFQPITMLIMFSHKFHWSHDVFQPLSRFYHQENNHRRFLNRWRQFKCSQTSVTIVKCFCNGIWFLPDRYGYTMCICWPQYCRSQISKSYLLKKHSLYFLVFISHCFLIIFHLVPLTYTLKL